MRLKFAPTNALGCLPNSMAMSNRYLLRTRANLKSDQRKIRFKPAGAAVWLAYGQAPLENPLRTGPNHHMDFGIWILCTSRYQVRVINRASPMCFSLMNSSFNCALPIPKKALCDPFLCADWRKESGTLRQLMGLRLLLLAETTVGRAQDWSIAQSECVEGR